MLVASSFKVFFPVLSLLSLISSYSLEVSLMVQEDEVDLHTMYFSD